MSNRVLRFCNATHHGEPRPCGHCDALMFDGEKVLADRAQPHARYCSTECARMAVQQPTEVAR